MCFDIDPIVKGSDRTHAWKVVTHDNLSPQYRMKNPARYIPGTMVLRSGGPTSQLSSPWAPAGSAGVQAADGIYVYTSESAARKYVKPDEKIIKVKVRPSDFLHQSTCGQMATYHAVYVPSQTDDTDAFHPAHTYIVKSPNGALTELQGRACSGEKDCLYFDTTDPGRGWFRVVEKTVKTKEYVG